MMALMYPTRLAIVTCQAHKTGNYFVVKGNNAVDKASKYTISILTAPMVILESIPQVG